MTGILHPLDHHGNAVLEVKALPDSRWGLGFRLPAGTPQGDRVRGNLLARTSLLVDGRKTAAFRAGDGMVTEKCPAKPGAARRLDLLLSGNAIGSYLVLPGGGAPEALIPPRRLPTFLVKQAALDGSGNIHDLSKLPPIGAAAPRADLHTHLAGACSSDRLVAIGVERGVRYPAALLALAGIEAAAGEDGKVDLRALDPARLRQLARRMEVGVVRQVTFVEFETAYALRKPLVRDASTLGDVLAAIARECAASGVRYAELSTSDAVGIHCFPPFMEIARRVLPAVEEETGVRLRLLAACKRTNAVEAFDEDFARLRRFAEDPLIVGVDLNGHEVDPVDGFAGRLESIVRWSSDNEAGWSFRVHAGESPRHPANVKAVLEVAARAGTPIRIGHGVYGADAEALELAGRTRSIVEFNATSNLALNNIHRPDAVPVRAWLDAGARGVPGTDGHGILLTSIPQETEVLGSIGADAADIAAMAAVCEEIIAMEAERSKRLSKRPSAAAAGPWSAPARPPASTRLDLEAAAKASGVALVPSQDPFGAPGLSGRCPLIVSGSDVGKFPERDREVAGFLDALIGRVVRALDPYRVVLVTDATGSETERLLLRHALDARIPVLATLTGDCHPSSLALGPTHAAVFEGGHSGRMAALLGPLSKAPAAAALFAGGGSVAADEIRMLLNAGVEPVLVRGVGGASSWNGKLNPTLAVFDGDGACRALRYRRMPMLPDAPW